MKDKKTHRRMHQPLFRAAAVASLLLITDATSAANAATRQFGWFSIDFPDGYARLPKTDVVQFATPDRFVVTVDVLNHHAMSPQEEGKAIQDFRRYAQEQLVSLADRHGAIAIPLREETLSAGRILFSIACETQASQFGLFFLLISPHGNIAQLVVEGRGAATEQMPRFRPLMETGRWAGEEVSATSR